MPFISSKGCHTNVLVSDLLLQGLSDILQAMVEDYSGALLAATERLVDEEGFTWPEYWAERGERGYVRYLMDDE